MASYKTAEFGAKLKQLLTSSKFLYRDTDVRTEIRDLYAVGTLFREPTLCDVTPKFGGLLGNTRFLIVSSVPKSVGGFSENPEWQLCVLGTNQLFKVVDVSRNGSKNQITVLHIPDGFEEYFRSSDANFFESMLVPQTRADFSEACSLEALPELNSPSWKERVQRPLGLNLDGTHLSNA